MQAKRLVLFVGALSSMLTLHQRCRRRSFVNLAESLPREVFSHVGTMRSSRRRMLVKGCVSGIGVFQDQVWTRFAGPGPGPIYRGFIPVASNMRVAYAEVIVAIGAATSEAHLRAEDTRFRRPRKEQNKARACRSGRL